MNKPAQKLFLLAILSIFPFLSAFAQTKTVTGNVVDEFDEPIIGAYITLLDDSSVGTITDFDGNFTIDVPSDAKLVISYTGYESNTVSVANKTHLAVILREASQHLDEVVAVGYGSQKAKEITSSVASVKSDDFNQGSKESPMGLLQGKVAGLNIVRSGSDPTSTGYAVQIRGFSTLDKGAGTSPLYIVDGIPVDNIDNIAPDDIESMDVLKDGSSAAIYGTRGTNGVILITTKRGGDPGQVECGVANVEYSGYFSTATNASSTGLTNDPAEFRNLEAMSNGAVIPNIYTDPQGNTYNTNWMDLMMRDAAFTHNHNVALSGATKNFSYRGSVNFKNAQGIAYNSNRQEIIAKLAANQKALQGWLDLQYDFSYMHYRNDFNCGDFKQASILNPTYPVYDATDPSGYFQPTATDQSNTIEAMNLKESYGDGNFFRGAVKATVNIKPVPGLKVSGFAAFEEGDNYTYWYNDQNYSSGTDAGKAGRGTSRNMNQLYEATIDYSGSWNGHNLAVVAGFSYQYFLYDGSDIANAGFPVNSYKYYNMGAGAPENVSMSMSSYRNSYALASTFARANYNYLEKYLLSASIRYEGSSRFGENNKWGWFPAASAGWRISGEDFLKDVRGVDDLKIRFGFGITGNNLASSLQSMKLMTTGGNFWYNGEFVTTYKAASNANPYLQWEKKYEYNLGIDFAFLDNRLYGSVDLYLRQTKDLLWEYDVNVGDVTPSGINILYDKLLANAGEMESKGVEFALTGVPVKTKDWNWTTTVTMAFNDNKITNLSDPDNNLYYSEMLTGNVGENGLMNVKTQKIVEGQSVGTFYGYKVDHSRGNNGIDNRGNLIYEDNDGDGKADEQIIGHAQPLFSYGWNNVIRWRWIDLTLFFRGVYGNDVLNLSRWAYSPQSGNTSTAVFKQEVENFADGSGVYRQKDFSDYYLEDGSYLKLDNITLGFTIPLKPNKYVQNLRIYATVQNVFTITSYSGMDPEVDYTGVWSPGIDDCSFYPTVRTFLLGVNVKF